MREEVKLLRARRNNKKAAIDIGRCRRIFFIFQEMRTMGLLCDHVGIFLELFRAYDALSVKVERNVYSYEYCLKFLSEVEAYIDGRLEQWIFNNRARFSKSTLKRLKARGFVKTGVELGGRFYGNDKRFYGSSKD